MALDDRYANKFASLNRTAINPKFGHALLYTQPLTGEMKYPTSHTYALCIPFHLLQCWCHTSINLHQATWSSTWINPWLDLPWMIWSTSYHHVTFLVHRSQLRLLFTIASVHRLHVFAQASPPCTVCRFKASDLPFTLAISPLSQALSWSFPPSNMIPCHVSYAMSSFITCVSLATNPSHISTYGLITCVSHSNTY